MPVLSIIVLFMFQFLGSKVSNLIFLDIHIPFESWVNEIV